MKKELFKIGDAIRVPDGRSFFRIENDTNWVWISASSLVANEANSFSRINDAGILLVSPSEKARLRNEIQARREFRSAVVATQPGWVSNQIYVHPNGDVQSLGRDTPEVIVMFTPDPTYATRGKRKKWNKGIAPFVDNQPVLTFLLAYGFAAPLIKFVRPSIQNLCVELVGEREAGKTTAGLAVGSIFGGCEDNDIGIGRTANMTKHSFKPLQRMSNDSLLFLDETNLIDKSVVEDLNIFFEQTAGDERARFGSSQRKESVRNALLMTGNVPLEESVTVDAHKLEAARSRNIRIHLSGSIFPKTPSGFDNNQAALRGLRSLAVDQYGTPIRAFVKRIIEINKSDPEAISKRLEKIMSKFEKAVPREDKIYNRLVRACALVYAAGVLAIEWEILPAKITNLNKYCLKVLSLQTHSKDSVIERLVNIIQKNDEFIIRCSKEGRPNRAKSKDTLGFRIPKGERQCFYFCQGVLKERLGSDAVPFLKKLRNRGILSGEGGANKKLCTRAPRSLGLKHRVYRMFLTRSQLEGC